MPTVLHAKRIGVIAVGLVLGAGVSTAKAESPNGGSDDPPPSTLTLDRMDDASRLGIQVGFDKFDDEDVSDGFAMRYELYGQYVLPNGLAGLYLQLPFAHLFNFTSNDRGEDFTALSNIDIGTYFLPLQGSNLIVRVGLALPTASDDFTRRLTNVYTTFERLTDLILAANGFTTGRLSVSTVQESGRAFFRGDLGFDLVLDKPASARDASVYLRANFAGGIRLDAVDLAAEIVNWGAVNGDVSAASDKRFFHTFAAGFSTRGTNQFRMGMVFPLDEVFRGEIWIFSFGYQHATS
jgi:hypothetical protein